MSHATSSPSALTVLLGSLAGISIAGLLIAGVVPGALLSLTFIGYIMLRAKLDPGLAPAFEHATVRGWARWRPLALHVVDKGSVQTDGRATRLVACVTVASFTDYGVNLVLVSLAMTGCSATVPSAGTSGMAISGEHQAVEARQIQSRVMSMSDVWNAALGEATHELRTMPGLDLAGQTVAIAFLRNGMGASIDIAVGPNPRVAMLDLLVLSALQTWALETNWAGTGLPRELPPGAKRRLAAARAELLATAADVYTPDQLETVQRLVNRISHESRNPPLFPF